MRTYVILCLTMVVLIISPPSLAKRHKKKSILDEAAKAMDLALVTAPRDQETCFSPDEHCDVKLVKFVSNAKKSIDVAIFDINLDQLVHQLLIQSRQLKVRIVVDKRQAKGDHSLVPLLAKAGAEIRYGRQRGIMHDKFTIVDGAMIETGSFNYTNHAYQANQENQVYLANPLIVERYKSRFEKIWQTAKEIKLSDHSEKSEKREKFVDSDKSESIDKAPSVEFAPADDSERE